MSATAADSMNVLSMINYMGLKSDGDYLGETELKGVLTDIGLTQEAGINTSPILQKAHEVKKII
ncbi:hypothetical protein [Pectinatus haikarae]|uniref:Uncharacterized protein n=1 Tax=Pectinatus haikarae TaxID=349096 RepID=A0ABT9YC46_9FIRM|nr:hypothetical protein [Pectinatus haikarae]MDQ0205198.1 hypothetical protein [Pectinatus haikarae]